MVGPRWLRDAEQLTVHVRVAYLCPSLASIGCTQEAIATHRGEENALPCTDENSCCRLWRESLVGML